MYCRDAENSSTWPRSPSVPAHICIHYALPIHLILMLTVDAVIRRSADSAHAHSLLLDFRTDDPDDRANRRLEQPCAPRARRFDRSMTQCANPSSSLASQLVHVSSSGGAFGNCFETSCCDIDGDVPILFTYI